MAVLAAASMALIVAFVAAPVQPCAVDAGSDTITAFDAYRSSLTLRGKGASRGTGPSWSTRLDRWGAPSARPVVERVVIGGTTTCRAKADGKGVFADNTGTSTVSRYIGPGEGSLRSGPRKHGEPGRPRSDWRWGLPVRRSQWCREHGCPPDERHRGSSFITSRSAVVT